MRCGTHPAANGHFSAEALALFYHSALVQGKLVAPEILKLAIASRRREDSLTKIARAATGVEIDIGFGMGYQVRFYFVRPSLRVQNFTNVEIF